MDEYPECVVCSIPFKYRGPKPKLLPCLHAVCENCVSSDEMRCSVCQKTFNVERAALPTDSVRVAKIFQLTAKNSPSEFLCTHREDGNQAVSWCQECEDFFCEHCQTLHDEFKLTRKHKVRGIGELGVLGSVVDVTGRHTCTTHDKPLEFYDELCQCLVCYKCLIGDHKEHKTVPDEEYLKSCHRDFDEWMKKVTQKQKDVGDRLTSSYELENTIQEKSMTLKENIQHVFSELRTTLDQREKEVLMELEEILLHLRSANSQRQTFLKYKESECSAIHQYLKMALQMNSACDLLGLVDTAKTTARESVDKELPVVNKKEGYLTFSKEGLLELKQQAAMFGSLCTTQEESASPGMFEQGKPLLEDLKAKVRDAMESNIRLQEDFAKVKQVVKELGLTLHCLSEAEEDILWLNCTMFVYDTELVNRLESHINENGDLVNGAVDDRPCGKSKRRFQNYCGTSSTIPLSLTSSLQYWETVSKVNVKNVFTEYNLVLEVGLCQTNDRDQGLFIGGTKNGVSLTGVYCLDHSAFCCELRQNGRRIRCLTTSLPNKTGASTTWHFGIVCDVSHARVAVLDVERNLVFYTFDKLDTSEPLWPMFGVYSDPNVDVTMSLVVGEHIEMTHTKKNLIIRSLD